MRFLLQVALCKHIAGRQKNVCARVSVFRTRRVMYVKRVAQGYLQTPPPPVRINGCFLRPCSLTRESGCHLTDENSVCEMDTVLTRSQANHAAV